MPALGVNMSASYSSIGAIKELANLWQRYGARPAPGGPWRRIRAKAPWVSDRRREKWAEVSRAGVNE